MGGIYEGLLELVPEVVATEGVASFRFAGDTAGGERKQSGSYYTPRALVDTLVKSTLDPVIEDRLRNATSPEARERALLGITVCDPACGSGHFLLAAAERLAGMSPEPSIYRRREIRQRDVSVTLLADMSTSIMQHLPEGGGRLVDRIRAGVLLFAESMEEVGDAYSIAGFASKYRDNVSYFTIKEFDQPYTADVRSVIGGLSGRLATRMGAAIRHATARFAGVQSRRRLLLLLSDGRPEDYDDGGDRRYLHEDTRMAVKEAMAAGVHPFCITVDTMANQYLPQIFGRGHYLVLDHINSLPNKLPEIYLRLRR